MSPRRIDVFFYGLFMDADLLREQGLQPGKSRLARLDDCPVRTWFTSKGTAYQPRLDCARKVDYQDDSADVDHFRVD